jgi:cobalt-zinc-cadmium efflux system outer membrane protein
MTPRALAAKALILCAALAAPGALAQAQQPPAPSPDLPQPLTLQAALEIFRARGFDLLVAEASVLSAQGDLTIATAIPNPGLSASAGKDFRCASSQDCSVTSYAVGISDNNAISALLTGKRGLVRDVAAFALEAARRTRDDARRTLELSLKQAYTQVLLALAQREVARETRDFSERTRQLNERRFALGAIGEAELATTQVAALDAEQALDAAGQGLRASRVALAFLLGFRTLVPDYQVESGELEFALPAPLEKATRETLLAEAFARRPDLSALEEQEKRAGAALALARRNRIPDVGLSLGYSANGAGDSNVSPPNATIGLSFALPAFYLQGGEIAKAEADLAAQKALRQKARAQVVADVETAFALFGSTRGLVERMRSALLERAQRARDLVQVQYEKGASSLLDLLNAQRTYAAVRGEYAADLAAYWGAVAQLEQATAMELRR